MMGAWGTGIFEDDLTLDLRGDFEAALAEGLNVDAATARILEDYAEVLADEEMRPRLYFALAELQLEHGVIQQSVRREALAAIDSGTDLISWEETTSDDQAERRWVLEQLRTRLMAVRENA